MGFLMNLDRGRFSSNIRQSRSANEWESLFESAGFRVHTHVTHLSKTAIQIWDIGLRPLFPLLQKITRGIAQDGLPDIKQEWISTFRQFLILFVQMDEQLGKNGNHAFHCYVLEKL